ncbi:MAG: ATP-dependent Clp protease ATP-binding subunit [Patescibacteria group bacterium]|jgi:ATP-dependent Clp protease ATP-binding subunit ClpC
MKDSNCKIEENGTIIAKAIKIDALVSNYFFKFIVFIFYLISAAAIVADIGSWFDFNEIDPYRGWVLLDIGVFILYLTAVAFYKVRVRYPKQYELNEFVEAIANGGECNLFGVFSFELAKAWSRGLRGYADNATSKDIAKAILNSPDMIFILARIGTSKDLVGEYLEGESGDSDTLQLVIRALKIAQAESHHQIEVGDLFVALCEKDKGLQRFMSDYRLELQDLANIVYWQTAEVREKYYKKKFINPDNIKLTGGVGKDWIFGAAVLLKQYSQDLTRTIAETGLNLHIVGHDKEIKAMEEALTKQTGGNVLLVGEAGVGKKTTALGFVKRVYEGKAMGSLSNKHVLKLDIDSLLSGAVSGGEITQRLTEILNEATRAGNIILFIENIQNLFSSGDAGRVNASEVILPYLEGSGVYFVGTCDISSYNKYFATNGVLVERFTRVTIEEPDKNEMVRILEDIVPQIEYHTNSLISYGAIKETIHAADKFILNQPNPEKSINLLDGASAKATSERGETIITPDDILAYVSEKYDVPSGEVDESEKKKLLDLESIMHKRVIGQGEAINAIANALRRSRAGVTDTKKPIGSFLFLGSTGVGKTETAKALAEAYFGDESRMIRFDMSEFQNKQDIYRFIGSNISGEETQGVLTTAVRERPFSLLLFDEIEKAHPDILNLFLQVLDEGHLTDGSGRKVAFTNTIIIATSNAGANLIRQSVQSGVEYEKVKNDLLNYIIEQNIYRPEFLNRFTSVIVFSPLTREDIVKIATLMVKNLTDIVAKNKGVNLIVMPDAIVKLAGIGYDPQMGARPMSRAIQEKLEDVLAKKFLSGELQKGDSITMSSKDIL